MKLKNDKYFSISTDKIPIDIPLLYDLYEVKDLDIGNRSFIKIKSKGETLSQNELNLIKKKSTHIYIDETQRDNYLEFLVGDPSASLAFKSQFIKDSAINYLEELRDGELNYKSEALSEVGNKCKKSISRLLDTLGECSLDQMFNVIGRLSFHDFYTFDHSINVAIYAICFYKYIKENLLTNQEIIDFGVSSLFHDLGKLKLSNKIINNSGNLTPTEFMEIKNHPLYGFNMINQIRINHLDFDLTKKIVLQHHEHYDGSGYPNKLKGDDISFAARLVSVVDFFDALTTQRSYHDVVSLNEALNIMNSAKGVQIDPKIFEVFLHFVQRQNPQIVIKDTPNSLSHLFDPSQPHDNVKNVLMTYSINRRDLDEQHFELISILIEAIDLSEKENISDQDFQEKYQHIIDRLKNYVLFHFKYEEDKMNEINFKLKDDHIKQHKEFNSIINNFDILKKDFSNLPTEVQDLISNKKDFIQKANEIVVFCKDWYIRHIFGHDKILAEALNEYENSKQNL